jgi:hypothetical protein
MGTNVLPYALTDVYSNSAASKKISHRHCKGTDVLCHSYEKAPRITLMTNEFLHILHMYGLSPLSTRICTLVRFG